MSVTIGLATESDDAAIRRLLAESPVPGRVAVTYEREPSFFAGCSALGDPCQVIAARDDATGELAAVACRAIRRVWLGGAEAEVGYLGQLRVAERFRGRWLVSKGFRFLRDLHEDGRARSYVATLVEGNAEALGVLVGRRRRHYPAFREVARLETLALAARRRGRPRGVRRTEAAEAAGVRDFLAIEGRRRDLFPVVGEDWLGGAGQFQGLSAGDVLVADRGGVPAGAVALWDQRGYKQTVVRGYSGALGRLRPVYNAAAPALGRPRLPAVGEEIRYAYASLLAVERDDAATCRALLDAAVDEAARRGLDYVMLGLVDTDPLLGVARRLPHVRYRSRVYEVTWNEEERADGRLDGRALRLELAML